MVQSSISRLNWLITKLKLVLELLLNWEEIRLQQSAIVNVKRCIRRSAFDRKCRSVIASDAFIRLCFVSTDNFESANSC
jgi:hypothetical protein